MVGGEIDALQTVLDSYTLFSILNAGATESTTWSFIDNSPSPEIYETKQNETLHGSCPQILLDCDGL